MQFLALIGSIIKGWPETMKFLNKLHDGMEYILKLSKEKEIQSFLEDLDESRRKAESAQTLREKIDAAKSLSAIIRRI
jgi:hypothetical protein